MRITDLLDKRSISLDGAPKKKREALDMAIDMGGLFNKAAYVFGTAAIAAGNYDIMAAVMIGGMVKINLPKKSAIPFAAADPIHVLPACICWHW